MATALREIFARFVVDFDKRGALKRGTRSTDRAKRSLTDLSAITNRASGFMRAFGGIVAGALGTGAMVSLARSTMESTNELMRWSNRLNISVQELRGWTGASAQFGADVDDVTDALKELQLKAQDALTGGTAQAEMFQRIGIGLDDLRPRVNDVSQLMELFVGRLEQVNDEGLRNFTVDELMSDAGTRMLPVFNQGSEALRRMRGEIEQESGSLAILARQQSGLNRTMSVAKRRFETATSAILVRLIPALDWLVRKGGGAAETLADIVENTRLFEVAIAAAGTAAAIAAALTISSWGPVAAVVLGIGLVVLAIEDLVGTAKGADSVTKRLLESLLGVEGARPVLADIRDLFEGMSLAAKDFSEAVLDIISLISSSDVLDVMAGLVNPALGVVRAIEAVGRGPEQIETGVRGIGVTGRAVTGVRGAGATANAKALARERESVRLRMLASGADSVRASAAAASITQTVDARMDVNVSVAEATDAQEVDRRVRVAIRDAQDRQARQLQAALVREGGTGT